MPPPQVAPHSGLGIETAPDPGIATPAPDASVLAGAAATAQGTPGLSVRRVPNPRYRPPLAHATPTGLPAVGRIRALDHLRVAVTGREAGPATRFTEWALATGEELRGGRAVELTLTGATDPAGGRLRTARLEGRAEALAGIVGDAPPIVIPSLAALHNLRGATVGSADGGPATEPRWRAFGGVPTPVPGRATPRLAVGGVAASELSFDVARFSFAAIGFGRGATFTRGPVSDPDSLPGHGGAGSFGWRVPLGSGWLVGDVIAQLHDLDGPRVMAAAHVHELRLATRTVALMLHDERASARTRRIGTDRFSLAPSREDRWNLQTRLFRGRAEAHIAGALRAGGDLLLASRTIQLGGSGNLGASPWYGGLEATWDHRDATGLRELRLVMHAGMVSDRGRAFLGRIERASQGTGSDAVAVAAETAWPLRGGAQLALLPRLGWADARLEHASAGARLTCPLVWAGTRLTASLSLGAVRDEGFRGRMREASLAMSWSPRLRDRGEIEVRRLSEGTGTSYEYSAAYDASFQRYESPAAGWLGARDSNSLEVRVVRAGDRTPVADALVSLDGRDLRFTDADGRARFTGVTPGVHVVSLEERSLPEHARALHETRVFVTVERGVSTPPVLFEVARPERRTRF